MSGLRALQRCVARPGANLESHSCRPGEPQTGKEPLSPIPPLCPLSEGGMQTPWGGPRGSQLQAGRQPATSPTAPVLWKEI